MRKLVLTLILLTILSGCATTGKMNRVSLGMTKQDVISAMGNPDSTSANGEVEYLTYSLYRGFFDRNYGNWSDNYFVRLKDGKVDSYGRVGDFDSVERK